MKLVLTGFISASERRNWRPGPFRERLFAINLILTRFRFRFISEADIGWVRVEHQLLFNAFGDQGNVLEVASGDRSMNHLFRVSAPAFRFER